MKVIINGREHSVAGATMRYSDIVVIAGMRDTPTMTWRIRGTNECGEVEPFGEVAVRENLVLNVVHTSNA